MVLRRNLVCRSMGIGTLRILSKTEMVHCVATPVGEGASMGKVSMHTMFEQP